MSKKRFSTPERLRQVKEIPNPTLVDVFSFERIFDQNGYPYLADTPTAYAEDGPQMELGRFPYDDATKRQEHGAVINFGERDNAVQYFAQAMNLLATIQSSYVVGGNAMRTQILTVGDALRVAHMGIELPRYLLWKQSPEFENGELPPETILLSRALRGFHGLVRSMHLRLPLEERKAFIDMPYSAEALLQKIIDTNQLEAALSCVASVKMIEKMLLTIGGTETDVARKSTTQEFGFTISETLNFSRAMRSMWDSLFPGLEYAIGLADNPNNPRIEVQKQIGNVAMIANMATQSLRFAIGHDRVSDMPIDVLVNGFIDYVTRSQAKEEELKRTIADFVTSKQ